MVVIITTYLVCESNLIVNRESPLFRIISIVTLLLAVIQIALGGIVRVTDSGLGCPDWPLCYGQIIPPFELTTLIEYSHRLSASLLMMFMTWATVLSFKEYGRRHSVTLFMILALLLVLAAATLGGITVLTELLWWAVLIHLAIAESVVACLGIAIMISLRQKEVDKLVIKKPGWFYIVLPITIATVFVLILSGSYMVGLGYGSSCGDWPLCNGELFPTSRAYFIHMVHRYIVVIAAIFIGLICIKLLSRKEPIMVRALAFGLFTVFAVQVVIGAVTVWTGFEPLLKSIHLPVATIVWLLLVLLIPNFSYSGNSLLDKLKQ